jgi:murein DD-endopeptidase MepM/ murein hydrolase activator NlpD
MRRRTFLSATLSLAVLSRGAVAVSSRLRITGSLEQGNLVIGHTDVGARMSLDDVPLVLTPDGAFVFGLAYDRTTTAKLVATFADGTVERRDIVPVVRQYDIQRIDGLKEDYVSPPPDIVARIANENKKVYAVRDIASAGNDFAAPFDWPVAGIVSGVFGSQRILNGEPRAPHFGVDIAAPEGTPIHAPAGATVTLAEPDFYLTGGTTVLDHGHGVSTTYQHQSALDVVVGQRVERGTVIGLVGKKGRATGPHLHWALNWFQVRLDPAQSARTPLPPRG